MYGYIEVSDDGGIRKIALNRPTSLNAINYDLLDELDAVTHDSHNDSRVRVVVIRGNGRAFCAGDDLSGMGTVRNPLPDNAVQRAELGYPRLILALRRMAKPVIAQVHGFAMGAGCDLVLSCDLVFTTADTQFGMAFTRRGVVAGTVLLPRLVGYHRACELLLSGRTFDADEAHRLGVVNAVVASDRLDEEVDIQARALASGPTAAYGLIKRAINQGLGVPLETAVEFQRHATAASYHTADYSEGKQAFLDKREPSFRGN